MAVPERTTDLTAAARANALDEVWKLWAEHHDPQVRNQLAVAYFPLVKHVARTMASSLSDRVELDDLIGFGAEGLLAAIERFDACRGVQFSTFAAYRIRGAIYDGIRATDWVPRSIRRRERELKENFTWLCHEFGREPTDSEEAELFGMSLNAFRAFKSELFRSGMSSLQATMGDDNDRVPGSNGEVGPGPLEVWLTAEEAVELQSAVGELSDRERSVITLSYHEEMTLAEIGRQLGVTESRVCQMRGSALHKLRRHLEARGMVPV